MFVLVFALMKEKPSDPSSQSVVVGIQENGVREKEKHCHCYRLHYRRRRTERKGRKLKELFIQVLISTETFSSASKSLSPNTFHFMRGGEREKEKGILFCHPKEKTEGK